MIRKELKFTLAVALLFIPLLAELANAQQTKREVINTTTSAADSKPNSKEIPDVIPVKGEFEQIMILRLKYKTDLLNGLQESIEELGIQNGVILSGIGSVRNYHIHSVSNREFPSNNIYIRDPSGPADITGMNGYIIDGRVHAHITLANGEKAFGGHLEEGTNVFTFAIVTIGIFSEGIDLSFVDDKTYR